jgi:signal recognition particle subunit SRP54
MPSAEEMAKLAEKLPGGLPGAPGAPASGLPPRMPGLPPNFPGLPGGLPGLGSKFPGNLSGSGKKK